LWEVKEVVMKKPTWIIDKDIEKSLKSYNEQELENLTDLVREFLDWIQPKMEKHNDFVINFRKKWVPKECDKFVDENGWPIEEIEEGWYKMEKDNYLFEYEAWEYDTKTTHRRKTINEKWRESKRTKTRKILAEWNSLTKKKVPREDKEQCYLEAGNSLTAEEIISLSKNDILWATNQAMLYGMKQMTNLK
jgi:hypothetical protein